MKINPQDYVWLWLLALLFCQPLGAANPSVRLLYQLTVSGDNLDSTTRLQNSLEAALFRLPQVAAIDCADTSATSAAALFSQAEQKGATHVLELALTLPPAAAEPENQPAVSSHWRLSAVKDQLLLQEKTEALATEELAANTHVFWLPVITAIDSVINPRKILLSMGSKTNWEIDLGLYMGQYAAIGLAYVFFNHHLVAGAVLNQSVIGFSTLKQVGHTRAPYLLEPGLAVRAYLLQNIEPIRPYLALALLARLAVEPFALINTAPLDTQLMAGVEFRPGTPRLALFAEAGIAWYPWCQGYYLALARYSYAGGITHYAWGPDWFLEYPQFRLGIRITP